MNERFKFRVWDKKHNEYIPSSMISTLLYFGHRDEFHIEFECFSTFDDSLIIEQCTGLSDKNGNLIYEGDVVKDMWGDALFIKWRDSEARFAAEDDNVAYDLEDVVDGCDIIGNVHEQTGQKD